MRKILFILIIIFSSCASVKKDRQITKTSLDSSSYVKKDSARVINRSVIESVKSFSDYSNFTIEYFAKDIPIIGVSKVDSSKPIRITFGSGSRTDIITKNSNTSDSVSVSSVDSGDVKKTTLSDTRSKKKVGASFGVWAAIAVVAGILVYLKFIRK